MKRKGEKNREKYHGKKEIPSLSICHMLSNIQEIKLYSSKAGKSCYEVSGKQCI